MNAIKCCAVVLAIAWCRGFAAEERRPGPIRVAAVQMITELGQVEQNLARAERLVEQAFAKGAEWVILPEFFTSGMGVHHSLLDAARPLQGEPTKLLQRLAKKHKGVVGGSFLALRSGETYNTFVLAFPDGTTFFHDKDYPTFWENNYYLGGSDDGAFTTSSIKVGTALCWEFVRSGTARRLENKVDLVVGGACWWAPKDDATGEAIANDRKNNLDLIKATPVKFAKMLGVPVVFAQQAGSFSAFADTDEKEKYNAHFIGETVIVDGTGKILARRSYEEGEGIVLADVTPGKVPGPTEAIPNRFWIPDLSGLNGGTKEGWEETLKPGRKYYDSVTKPHRAARKLN